MGARNINAIHGNNIPEIPNNLMNIEEMDENQQNLIPIEQQNLIVQERTISKKILAARLPTNLDKKTLSLEHDSLSLNKSYLKFNYDSLVDIDCYINFNVSKKSEFSSKNSHHKLLYSPSINFVDKGYYIKGLKSGENLEFFNKETYIDLRNYYNEKEDNQNMFDVCIEFVPLFPPGSPETEDNNEIVFVTLCNFERHQDDNTYIIKCVKQRLRTHNIWIDLYDIFDSALEGGLCLICCSEKRNTIFLPCKHAGCCNKCGSEIKYRFKPCPICKTPIDDLLIVNSDEKKIKKGSEEETSESLEKDLMSNDNNIINADNSLKINDTNTINESADNDEEYLLKGNHNDNNKGINNNKINNNKGDTNENIIEVNDNKNIEDDNNINNN